MFYLDEFVWLLSHISVFPMFNVKICTNKQLRYKTLWDWLRLSTETNKLSEMPSLWSCDWVILTGQPITAQDWEGWHLGYFACWLLVWTDLGKVYRAVWHSPCILAISAGCCFLRTNLPFFHTYFCLSLTASATRNHLSYNNYQLTTWMYLLVSNQIEAIPEKDKIFLNVNNKMFEWVNFTQGW